LSGIDGQQAATKCFERQWSNAVGEDERVQFGAAQQEQGNSWVCEQPIAAGQGFIALPLQDPLALTTVNIQSNTAVAEDHLQCSFEIPR
jgi:hypothetical protein